jgi:valyl-tRNA synthetase
MRVLTRTRFLFYSDLTLRRQDAMTEQANSQLSKNYDPSVVEARLYSWWQSQGYFKPTESPDAEPFVITIPPPNVTGELHLGHLLTYTLEDVIGRYKRMNGFATLILPGSDHAGIAVHSKVEALLASEGIRRRDDIGREAFVQRAWEWKQKYGTEIAEQFRVLGESFDWSRERFTMDPGYYRAVMTMFVQLYNEGYIYRGARVINWCPGCRTGISDIEVRPEERQDSIFYVRLPFDDGSGEIVVATVRPETMFGDVAVAVHPDDARHATTIGKHIRHPLTGELLPIIADGFVEPDFGSGAVKITPAHDYADFEVAERHDLPMPVVITTEGTMAESVSAPYTGLPIIDARTRAVDQLTAGGFMVKIEPLTHNVPLCDRCGTVIEPLLSEQWFMHMKQLAQPAMEAVISGKVRFVPDRWSKIYLDWMENIRPWNISRQLWWGQRIPVYHCANGHITVAVDAPTACAHCASTDFTQDPDVLDTWFSSALWPFATMGWPDDTEDLHRFYPTSFMNTSSQILYLWIARMIMMGIHFRGEIPFPVVLINPTILNEKGQRMSKSLGTGIDPRDSVSRYGADATRYGILSAGSLLQQEIRIAGYERAEEGQKFANKIWNAARLTLSAIENTRPSTEGGPMQLDLIDRWILSRLANSVDTITSCMESYDLSVGMRQFYDFFWREFADWYLELVKPSIYGDDPKRRAAAVAVLWSVLDRSMRIVHPYMPFISEEIWQRLCQNIPAGARELSGLSGDLPDSIMIAPWPATTPRDARAEKDVQVIVDIITALRNLRAEHGIAPGAKLSATAVTTTHADLIQQNADLLSHRGSLSDLSVVSARTSGDSVAEIVLDGVSILVPLAQLRNVEEELERSVRERDKKAALLEAKKTLLNREGFRDKAPAHVIAGVQGEVADLESAISTLDAHIAALRSDRGH